MASSDQHLSVPMYSLAERDRRWTLARSFMEREGLDALLVFSEHEDAGPAPVCFDTWFTNDRAGTTVLLPRAGEPVVFMPLPTFMLDHMEALRRGDGSWVAPHNVRLGRFSASIAAVLDEHNLGAAKIGVFGLEPYIPWHPEGIVPYVTWNAILTRFPDAEFRPVALAFARLMMPLSDEEVAVVRHSAKIGDEMARAMVAAARPGVSEAEVYAAGMNVANRSGTVVPGMHFWTGPAPAASGPPQWAFRPQPSRVLQDGDFIHAEAFSSFGMRQTQHQVAIAVGDVDEDVERAALVARASYEAGLKALRPGTTFGQVSEAMLSPLEAAGGWTRGPQIHGLNPYGSLCRIPAGRAQVDGAENYPSVPALPTGLADLVLEPGMTFAFEPSCGFGNHLVTLGGTVIVGENEAIELNAYTAQLLRAGT